MPVDISLPLYEVIVFADCVGSRFSCVFLHPTAALRFQPTKRPQLSAQKSKPKPPVQRTPAPVTASKIESNNTEPTNAATRPSAKTTLADWTAEGEENDINGFYGGEKRQRGGRKKRKKNKEESHVPQNWDDIYDPSRPNSYEDYKHSDEKITEMREWKNKLYAHRITKRCNSDSDSSGEDYRPQMNSRSPSMFVYKSLHWHRAICPTSFLICPSKL